MIAAATILSLALAVAGRRAAAGPDPAPGPREELARWRAARGREAVAPAPPPPAAPDLLFARAVEDWVAMPASALPAPWKARIDALGDRDWRRREAASRAILAGLVASPGDARWLMVGRRHPDPEVRLRCNTALRRASPCPTCDGKGHPKDWPDWSCSDCGGSGSAWPFSPWD